MKKIFGLIALLVFSMVLVACNTSNEAKIAMITDTGDIDDGSFNQGTWEGIKNYAKEHKISHRYYKPLGTSTTDYMNSIDLAVAGGAEIVIAPGFYFEVPIFEAQTKYPDVKFVILDGSPHNGDFNSVVATNTLSIFFKEEQSGFLAGYAAVQEGLTKIGFMGGIAVPAVQRFGIGYIAGAYKAANEKGVSIQFNADHYVYLGTFGVSDAYKAQATTWYNSGVEVIHAAAGGAGFSVMAAAQDQATTKWVIGVDSDQSNGSDTVLTSAVKGVGAAAYQALEALYNDEFPGGTTWNLGADSSAVGLPMETSRFTKFTTAQYASVFGKIVDKSIVVPTTAAELTSYLATLQIVNDALIAKI